MKSKRELIRHYKKQNPNEFVQLIGNPDDGGLYVDAEGDAIVAGAINELMADDFQVRVLIPMHAELPAAIRLLKKTLDWLESANEKIHRDDFQEWLPELEPQ